LFVASTVLTAFMLFMLGAAKSKYSYRTWYASGFETLFLGACTAGATYLVGWALEGVAIG
jgi:VIT1/CCC1 family predicted Fe2+/Mn2+ transporter